MRPVTRGAAWRPAPARSGYPHRQRPDSSDPSEVDIGREHRQLVAQAQSGEQHINGAHLKALPPAGDVQLRRPDVIVAIGHEKRQS